MTNKELDLVTASLSLLAGEILTVVASHVSGKSYFLLARQIFALVGKARETISILAEESIVEGE